MIKINDLAGRGHFSSYRTIVIPSLRGLYLKKVNYKHAPYSYGAFYLGSDVYSFLPQNPAFIRDGFENVVVIKETRSTFTSVRNSPCLAKETHELTNEAIKCYINATLSIMKCKYIDSVTGTESIDTFCHTVLTPYNAAAGNAWKACVENVVGTQISCKHTHFDVSVRDMENRGNDTTVYVSRIPAVLYVREHELYTWQVYLSNIGGLFSLLCGASVVSLFQAVFYGSRLMYRKLAKEGEARKESNEKGKHKLCSTNEQYL